MFNPFNAFRYGTQVVVKLDKDIPEWFEGKTELHGAFVGVDDGLLVIRLEEPVMFYGKPCTDFTFRPDRVKEAK